MSLAARQDAPGQTGPMRDLSRPAPSGPPAPPRLPAALAAAAEHTRGFMPPAEGLALFETATAYARRGPVAEIGTYCGKSTIYLAAAARQAGPGAGTVD